MPEQQITQNRIVAGVDGSTSSIKALRWAVGQAVCTGCTVEAVIAWHYPAQASGLGWASTFPSVDFAESSAKILAEAVSEAVDPRSDVTVTTKVAEGNPAEVLLAAAEGARLLVVGSRGHGGFTEALLGSVAQHCTHRASCPVVIVRA